MTHLTEEIIFEFIANDLKLPKYSEEYSENVLNLVTSDIWGQVPRGDLLNYLIEGFDKYFLDFTWNTLSRYASA